MTTAQQALADLGRSEADIRQARAILACLADASMCPPEWVDQFDELRRAHYTSTLSTYDQVRTELGQEEQRKGLKSRPEDIGPLTKRFDQIVPFPLPIPGLPPRARAKVAEARTAVATAGQPSYVELMRRQLGTPRLQLPQRPGVELPAEVEKLLENGYGRAPRASVVAGYKEFTVGAGIAVGLSFVAGVLLYRLLGEDPATEQLREQSRQYREYLGVVGPVLQQVATGMREGTISAEQAAQMLTRLQTLCPEQALPAIPGAGVCGIGSCAKWFWPAAVIAAVGIAGLAWSRGYFKRLSPGESASMLPPPRSGWWTRRGEATPDAEALELAKLMREGQTG